ncbi:hypothetical protein C2E23DRAFT_853672 [Lenzites betulinus]|nr:hypothetical protein C2E23DRAFT_853672 [Lenzites betulinus]
MLSKLDIVPGYGRLVSRAMPSDVLENKLRHAQDTAADHVMSSHNLIAKLNFLLRHSMSDTSEAHARLWIDSFLFRVTAMVANERRLLIGVEVFAASETLVVKPRHIETSGKIDYVLLLVDEAIADSVLSEEDLHGALRGAKPGTVHGLFVAEAKGPSENLLAHLPQAIVEMQACARRLKSRHIRGTLTCGKAWCFLFLKLNENLVGGTYWVSPRFDVGIVPTTLGPRLVDEESVVAIVARLYDWVMHAAEELDDVGWFVVR